MSIQTGAAYFSIHVFQKYQFRKNKNCKRSKRLCFHIANIFSRICLFTKYCLILQNNILVYRRFCLKFNDLVLI
jgi:hypothetical protein